MGEDEKAYYAGVEPVDVGNLDSIREEKSYIPATRDVRLHIRKAEIRVNEAKTYHQIALQLQIVNGIDSEGKYQGKVVFTRVCYYADPNQYTSDFFAKKQHLVQLKQLSKATGVDLSKIDGHTPELLEQAPDILGNIIVTKGPLVEGGLEVKDDNGNTVMQFDNEVRQFKSLPVDQQV